ncbi:DUF6884 domain-containing protein [Ectobacillus ponti]|uniref:DUF6884 domain-containing protein n=1 Tax=Ectobacillus ponti TaxID=2961894 RepID=A0AA41X8Q2_9BACI|nr:DUF6884 domain-containing protein [Ectobacillus ponti]MCP8970847.1 hypothetical protein [Ectobacillus ponti]
MKQLCIIPCGAKKIWDQDENAGKKEAKHVYMSTFHKACQSYAETFFENWTILSAKHGFLLPTDIVEENYDVAFGSKSPEIISTEALQRQIADKGLGEFRSIVVLGGKKYRKVVEQAFGDSCSFHYPLADCRGIGYMVQRLQAAVARGESME